MDIGKAGSDKKKKKEGKKRFGAVVEECRGLGFLWCWSLDQKKDIL